MCIVYLLENKITTSTTSPIGDTYTLASSAANIYSFLKTYLKCFTYGKLNHNI